MAGVLHLDFADIAGSQDPESTILARLKAHQAETNEEFSGLLVLDLAEEWPDDTLDVLTDTIGTTYVETVLLVYRGPFTTNAVDDWAELRARRRQRMQVLWLPDADGCMWTGDPLETPTIPPPTGEGNLQFLDRFLSDDRVLRALVETLASTDNVCVPGVVAYAVDTRQLATELTAAANDVATGQKRAAARDEHGPSGLTSALPQRLLNAAGHGEGEWKRAIRAPINRLNNSIDKLDTNGGKWASVPWYGGLLGRQLVEEVRQDIGEAGEAARGARLAAEGTLSRVDPADFVDQHELAVMDEVLDRPPLSTDEEAEMQAAPVELRREAIDQLRQHGALPAMMNDLDQIHKRVNVRTGEEILGRLRERCDTAKIAAAIQAAERPVSFPLLTGAVLFAAAGLVAGFAMDSGGWYLWTIGLVVLAAASLLALHPSPPSENIVPTLILGAAGTLAVLVGRGIGAWADFSVPPILGIAVAATAFASAAITTLTGSIRGWLRSVSDQTKYLAELPANMTEVLDLARREWNFANDRIRVGRMAEALRTAMAGAQHSLQTFGVTEDEVVTDTELKADGHPLEAKVFGGIEPLDSVAVVRLRGVVQKIVATAVGSAIDRVVIAGADMEPDPDYSSRVADAVDAEARELYKRLMAQGIIGVIAGGGFDEAEQEAIETCRSVWDKSESRKLLTHPSARIRMIQMCGARECDLLDEDLDATRFVLAYPRGYLFAASIEAREGTAVEYSRPDHAVLLRAIPVRIEKAHAALGRSNSSMASVSKRQMGS